MASAVGSPSKGRRKSLDAEINLVPFIDLLSMCICFLLMTAIWVEISSIQIKQILGTAAPAVTKDAVDLQVRFLPGKDMSVQLERAGQVVQSFKVSGDSYEQKLNQLSNYVGTLMNALLTAQSGEGPNVTARIIPSASFNYAELIQVLDMIRGYGIANLAVVPTKE